MDLLFNTWQADFNALADSLYRICRKVLALRPASADRDDDAQEAVCLAMDRYRRLHGRGLAHLATPATLARYALADVRRRRRFAGTGTGKRGKSRRDAADVATGDESALAGVYARTAEPATAVAVAEWLDGLAGRARDVAELAVAGLDGQSIADALGVSTATVSNTRRDLAAAWAA